MQLLQVIAILLATGVAAGFLVTMGLKDFFRALYDKLKLNLKDTNANGFFNKAYQSAAFLTGAFLFMVVLWICSYLHQKTKTTATTTNYEISDNFG